MGVLTNHEHKHPKTTGGKDPSYCALSRTYSVKLTRSQLGPETPIMECDVSLEILSRLVW